MMSHSNLLGIHPESFTTFCSTPPPASDDMLYEAGEGIADWNQDSLAIWPTPSLTVVPISFPWRDLLHAELRNMFLDEAQTKGGRTRNGETSAGPKHGIASGDLPTMAVESQGTADGASGSERTRRSQSVDSLTHRLERIGLLNDHRDELLQQCAQSRRLLEGLLCQTWLIEADVTSYILLYTTSAASDNMLYEVGEGIADWNQVPLKRNFAGASLAIWPTPFLSQFMSPRPASTFSSESTEDDVTTTVAASEMSDGFQKGSQR